MDRCHDSRKISASLRLFAGLTLAAFACFPLMARAASENVLEHDSPARLHLIRQIQRDGLMQGARSHIAQARARQAWERWLKKHPHAKSGNHVRPATQNDEGALPADGLAFNARAPRASVSSTQGIPANVRCNNPAVDAAGAGQAEQFIAASGNNILVAWNDGQGFTTGGDIQNYAYSTDGGTTFIQPAGGIPHPAAVPGFTWSSDPSVTLNEKTGEFYYSGLCDISGGTSNGFGVVKATFPGGASPPAWGAAHVARSVTSATKLIDKEWIVADSLSGNLYAAYTLFTTADDSIEFQRSTDQGATWGPVLICSADSAAGFVQGPRPAVGPAGEVYVTWQEIGISTAFSHMRIRKSTNAGVSFGAESKVADFFDNFDSGAPGFNRQRGVTFPSISVDRTNGPHRGRVYETWNESVNWFDDGLGGLGSKVEVEADDTPGTSTSFTPGQSLSGTISTTTDLDYFSFTATIGTTYIFWCQPQSASLGYTMRVMCNDAGASGTTGTRLALSGADQFTLGAQGLIAWTAPSSGTYYFRMAYNGGTGTYLVYTGVDAPSAGERSRDHRDIFVGFSDNGTTWSTPTRPNDDLGHFDDWLPEVVVGADGMPYVMWYDWRDANVNCYGSSHIYMSRSVDGGATWQANQKITSATTAWTTTTSNIAPNQGDYNGMSASGRFVYPTWADGRSGNDDVWATSFDTGFDMLNCPNDSTVTTGTTLPLTFAWANRNAVFANDYTYQLTDTDGWTSGAMTGTNVAALGSASIVFNVPVPSPANPVNDFLFTVKNSTGVMVKQCPVHVSVTGNLGAPPPAFVFGLRPAVPNPVSSSTRIDYSLQRSGNAKLVIYGLNGERVRTLVNGVVGAGPNSAVWDGKDDHGRLVRAGAYFYRLEANGRTATQRLVMVP